MSLTLVIGNRNYSSWSLRAWLYLRESGLEFEEVFVSLHTDNWREEVAKYSPAGRVPILIDDGTTVWDSTAIMSHLLDRYPGAVGWPADPNERALARSISAEMHSGFLAIRETLPQNIRIRRTTTLSDVCQTQINRVQTIWRDCRERCGHRGPWLFGDFSIADVMFVPVALRFLSYGIPVPEPAAEFMRATLALPSVQDWVRTAQDEGLALGFVDNLGKGDMILG
ncbi:MAG: glutathione S-transferase family protein [Gammaproteobacteria bacterium]|nr:glutathione S-transferase family protein [Gammaproteobacteria bacterium]